MSLPTIPLKHIPANDNKPDWKDVPVADRRHWLGYTERGVGFPAVERHPYRRNTKFRRDANNHLVRDAEGYLVPLPPEPLKIAARSGIAWLDAHLFDTGEKDDPESARITLNRKNAEQRSKEMPHRYRLLVRANIGAKDENPKLLEEAQPLLASPAERKWAAEGMPIEAEFRTGRIREALRDTAADFVDVYETANIESRAISDRHIDAKNAAAFLRFRLAHMWRPLVDAAVFGKTMASIGRQYGGNKEDAAKLGRQKVIDALLLSKECFDDMYDMKAREKAAERASAPMTNAHVSTLGRKSADLPFDFHKAANDNRRAIRDVA